MTDAEPEDREVFGRSLSVPFFTGWVGLLAALAAWQFDGGVAMAFRIAGSAGCVTFWGVYAVRRSRQQRANAVNK